MDENQKQLVREERRQQRRERKRAAARGSAVSSVPDATKSDSPLHVAPEQRDSQGLPLLFVSHHKCASTLASRYVRQFCAINGLSFFGNARGNTLPSSSHDVSFLGNASYPFLAARVERGGVHIIRNPLNIVQSAYFSHLRTHQIATLPILAAQRSVLEQCSAEAGMALTLAFCERDDFFPGTPGPMCALRQWDFDDGKFTTVRMEDFAERIDLALKGALGPDLPAYAWPDAHDYTFRAMSGGRKPGEIDESSAYRSGHPDAWRSELPKPIIAYVRAHYRDVLNRFYPDALLD